MTVHVVEWRYDGGGGFDWYYTADQAAKAHAEELKVEHWTKVVVYPFEAHSTDPEEVTREIDQNLRLW